MESLEALALISGKVEEEILIRNEYLAAENEILKSKLKGTIKFKDAERIRLAKIAKRMGLNAFSERWILSIKSECVSALIFFGEKSLFHALKEYVLRYHQERNHQGKENLLLFPTQNYDPEKRDGEIACRSCLGGMLKYYYRKTA
jgi:hypothetical protein